LVELASNISEAAIDRELCGRKLKPFIEAAWHVVEPGRQFVDNWHIDAIADHLEAVRSEQIRNLVITMPPRHMKSLTVSVFFPVWWWTTEPHIQFLYSSYSQILATRDSLKCRRIVQHPWFQARWGDVFSMTGDQNLKMRFENDQSGYRIATSVGGTATGDGGDVVACDDPHNIKDAESEAIRGSTVDWWDQVMSTRLNDPKTGRRIVIQQRTHEEDLAGHLIEKGWTELRLPAEFEPEHRCIIDVTGFKDPRTERDELLWPERMGREDLNELKLDLGPYGSAGQLQQRPAPLEGGIYKREWIREFQWDEGNPVVDGKTYPIKNMIRVGFVDLAASMRESADFTNIDIYAGERATKRLFKLHEINARMEAPEILTTLEQIRDDYGLAKIFIESAGFQLAFCQLARRAGLPIEELKADRDKIARALGAVPLWSRGLFWVPAHADWRVARDRELFTFPNVKHDDRCDTEAYACIWWQNIIRRTRPMTDAARNGHTSTANPLRGMI